jgi:hypothetical protein
MIILMNRGEYQGCNCGDLRKEFTEFKAEVRNPTALGQDLTGLVGRIDFLTLDMNRRFEDMAKRIRYQQKA